MRRDVASLEFDELGVDSFEAPDRYLIESGAGLCILLGQEHPGTRGSDAGRGDLIATGGFQTYALAETACRAVQRSRILENYPALTAPTGSSPLQMTGVPAGAAAQKSPCWTSL